MNRNKERRRLAHYSKNVVFVQKFNFSGMWRAKRASSRQASPKSPKANFGHFFEGKFENSVIC